MPGPPPNRAAIQAKTPSSARRQPATKRNKSILNFFQKTDIPPNHGCTSRQPRITQFATKIDRAGTLRRGDSSNSTSNGSSTGGGGLFLEDPRNTKMRARENDGREERSTTPEDLWGDRAGATEDEGEERYNENGTGNKKRRVDSSSPGGSNGEAHDKLRSKSRKISGPFIDESDSEDDLGVFGDVHEVPAVVDDVEGQDGGEDEDGDNVKTGRGEQPAIEQASTAVDIPPLVREATSHIEDDESAGFDDLEDDGFRGEDLLNPLDEEDESGQHLAFDLDDSYDLLGGECDEGPDPAGVRACPICQACLADLTDSDISVHVNNCLDGTPSPLPPRTPPVVSDTGLTRQEKAAIARPGQRDPYAVGTCSTASAFSKLMAGNAEDTAWSTAAANEVSSRGKQAYQRTCPFYKIIPGFSICVDAFRYGAVQGCNAYFLSHFHSDHYIGLTSSWRHGPVYCSKVTGNLVRQQLRVDPKWVVDLDFEKRSPVPETGGVQVTLIEANHCPGSALFLFEKTVGSGPSPRVQRVLHCGDFRASPAHVQHALLRPETLDAVTGQHRQQRIDVCYLDTTYMTPKYAFPTQKDVITACADLCVQLDQDDEGVLSTAGQGKLGSVSNAMSKFVSSNRRDIQRGARGRLLVVMGTYSIGKERICLGIARALQSKIYATPNKMKICASLEDEELSSLLTDDPLEAQVHMQTVFEIRGETLADYLDSMKPHFSRVVGFRPTGWNYRPPAGRMLDNPPVSTVLHSPHWKTPYGTSDLVAQRGGTRESACYGVPYSEHSSFRELTMFCCSLRIGRVIPTVNVGSRASREKMKAWIERWEMEKRKNGLFKWRWYTV